MRQGKGIAWHKRQLAALRAILEQAKDMPANSAALREIAARFVGACLPIKGSAIPAYHEPLLRELRRGEKMFAQVEVADKEEISAAIGWVRSSREHKLKKKPASAPPDTSGLQPYRPGL